MTKQTEALLDLQKIAEVLQDPFPYAGLTPRERQVVSLLARGHTRQTASVALGVATGTIKTLAIRASKKIGVSSSLWSLTLWNAVNNIIEKE